MKRRWTLYFILFWRHCRGLRWACCWRCFLQEAQGRTSRKNKQAITAQRVCAWGCALAQEQKGGKQVERNATQVHKWNTADTITSIRHKSYLFPFYFVLKTKTPGQANLLPDRIWQATFSKALGRSTTPSHPHSPGAAHSSKAEVASEKFQKVVSHARPCSFL